MQQRYDQLQLKLGEKNKIIEFLKNEQKRQSSVQQSLEDQYREQLNFL